jgi:hypothetical protein
MKRSREEKNSTNHQHKFWRVASREKIPCLSSCCGSGKAQTYTTHAYTGVQILRERERELRNFDSESL